jgi:hypothetical protein
MFAPPKESGKLLHTYAICNAGFEEGWSVEAFEKNASASKAAEASGTYPRIGNDYSSVCPVRLRSSWKMLIMLR